MHTKVRPPHERGIEVTVDDEPTSALDIGHQQSVLDLVDEMRLQDELAVVVADLSPHEVLRPVALSDVYVARVEVLQRDAGPAVLPLRGER